MAPSGIWMVLRLGPWIEGENNTWCTKLVCGQLTPIIYHEQCSARSTRTLGNRSKRSVSTLCYSAFPRYWCARPKTNLVIFFHHCSLYASAVNIPRAWGSSIIPKFFSFSIFLCCGRYNLCGSSELSKFSFQISFSVFFFLSPLYLLYNLSFRFYNICSLYLYVTYLFQIVGRPQTSPNIPQAKKWHENQPCRNIQKSLKTKPQDTKAHSASPRRLLDASFSLPYTPPPLGLEPRDDFASSHLPLSNSQRFTSFQQSREKLQKFYTNVYLRFCHNFDISDQLFRK